MHRNQEYILLLVHLLLALDLRSELNIGSTMGGPGRVTVPIENVLGDSDRV